MSLKFQIAFLQYNNYTSLILTIELLSYVYQTMRTSQHVNTFCIIGPLWGEPPDQSLVDCSHIGSVTWVLMFSLMLAEQTFEQTIELLVIWEAMAPMWHMCNTCNTWLVKSKLNLYTMTEIKEEVHYS